MLDSRARGLGRNILDGQDSIIAGAIAEACTSLSDWVAPRCVSEVARLYNSCDDFKWINFKGLLLKKPFKIDAFFRIFRSQIQTLLRGSQSCGALEVISPV